MNDATLVARQTWSRVCHQEHDGDGLQGSSSTLHGNEHCSITLWKKARDIFSDRVLVPADEGGARPQESASDKRKGLFANEGGNSSNVSTPLQGRSGTSRTVGVTCSMPEEQLHGVP